MIFFQMLNSFTKKCPVLINISQNDDIMTVLIAPEGYSPVMVKGSPADIDKMWEDQIMGALIRTENEVFNTKLFEDSVKKKSEDVKKTSKTTPTTFIKKKEEPKKPVGPSIPSLFEEDVKEDLQSTNKIEPINNTTEDEIDDLIKNNEENNEEDEDQPELTNDDLPGSNNNENSQDNG